MAFKLYNYVFTELAEADINDIISYISEDLSNSVAAANFADELEHKLNEICKNPNSGRLVNNEYLKHKEVRRFLVENYIAYYIIDSVNSRVVILRLVYAKRNQDKILDEL